ncbi:MAG: DUF1156 domain-containing protein, partial [Pseudomonadales bacterium]|nr:DUF1156 domain-containing protein [Pseudomonadales bacterium]
RPLAAARAVIFAQMVNDPGYQQDGGFKYGVNKKEAELKREKLFQIIRDLVKWENTNNEEVLNRAREAIKQSWRETCHLNRNHPQAAELFNPDKLPAFHDPFAGGGAIPLEAQRLGLESYASDLNPVAVMINKAMIEIPPKFAGQTPVGPIPKGEKQQNMMEDWSGAKGLAEDVRRYGHWMREEAFKRIGHLYPTVKVTPEMIAERPDLKAYLGEDLTIMAFVWARTVKNPNPAFSHILSPIVKSFWLSKDSKRGAYINVVPTNNDYECKVFTKGAPNLEQGLDRKGAICPVSGDIIPLSYIREEAMNGRLGTKLIAIIAEHKSGRIYLSPNPQLESIARVDIPENVPSAKIDQWAGCTNCVVYGMDTFDKLFSPRQSVALLTFSGLLKEVKLKIADDVKKKKFTDVGGHDNISYADAVAVYLAFAIDKSTDYWSTMCTWHNTRETIGHTFGRQAIPMSWDFVEANPFSSSSGNWLSWIMWVEKSINTLPCVGTGYAFQHDAALSSNLVNNVVVQSDPPYYDNVPYSNISDYFYVWLRRSLIDIYPKLFSTITVPKMEELVANKFRHGSKDKADKFFMDGMTTAMKRMYENAHPSFPVAIYYAFKQAETKEGSTSSTGWETFLESVIKAGFSIDGTWPMRTEMAARRMAVGNNALASSVVLVCKKREIEAESISRREFQRELREQMPDALEAMIGGETGTTPIAPVDLAQAAIGPGIAIYSKYAAVLNQDGSKMSVHDALILINRAITEYLNPDSGNFDADTLFCDDWFSQYGWAAGAFGEADTLARAKGTSVDGVRDAGVIEAGGGKVRLLKWSEYPQNWDPKADTRTPIWEACHQMIRVLNQQGESEAGKLLAKMPERGEPIRQLAYHLYTLCERKKWAEEARAYNELIGSWHAIVSSSFEVGHRSEQVEIDI